MARCARNECGRWRPDIVVRVAAAGFTVNGAWYCSPACVELSAQRRLRNASRAPLPAGSSLPPLKLGVLLIHQSAITPDALQRALQEQRRSGMRLGAQLQHLGLASSNDILRALAAQSGVSYLAAVDPARLHLAPGGLSRDMVRALGLIPFEASTAHRRMKVACVAPVPRLALGALRELTGWTAEPFLVSDADWNTMFAAYGAGHRDGAWAARTTVIRDLDDATSRIARVAQGAPGVTVTHARWDPYVWVRLQAPDHVEDLLLTDTPPPRKDTTWAA